MKLTKHFQKRSGERDIYPEMLSKILSGKYISTPSTKDESVELITGKHDNKLWTIVMNIETGSIITARRAHGKEIRVYEEAFK
ncbi:MAG: hypothetical protein MJZ05_12005 [Fibrobacter sp.]|nr:hypothetical protein [Fibrobacter sp.]